MKKINLVLLLLIFAYSINCKAQLASIDNKPEAYAQLRNSTTYYVLTGDEKFDTEMASLMKELWTLTPTEALSSDAFKTKVKEKTASFIVPILIGYDTQGYHYLALFNGGKKRLEAYGHDDLLAYCPINFWGNEKRLTDCSYRLRNMVQSLIHTLEIVQKKNLKGMAVKLANDLQKEYNKNTKAVKDRTLLFCSDNISKMLTEDKIATFYPHKFEICNQAKIEQVIKDKSKDYYYFQPGITMNKTMFIFDPSNGEVMYFDYQNSGMNITPSDVEDVCKAITGKK
jgi:hypothetical protein